MQLSIHSMASVSVFPSRMTESAAEEQPYFYRLRTIFGCSFLIGLHIIQHILKGFVCGGGDGGLAGTPIDFVLREYKVSGTDLQVRG